MKIITHGGKFHPDDIIACAILRIVYPGINIERSLKDIPPPNLDENLTTKEIENLDFIVDVGRVFDRTYRRFDHHQKDAPKRPNGVPFAAAGLIWDCYGAVLINMITARCKIDLNIKSVSKIWGKFEKEVIEVIDLMDNGQLKNLEDNPCKGIILPRIINSFISYTATAEEMNAAFMEVLDFIMKFIFNHIENEIYAEFSYEKICKTVDKTLEAGLTWLSLDEPGSWVDPVLENDKKGNILYVVYEDKIRNQWMVQCVPKSKDSFESRKPFPEILRGKDEKYLNSQLSGLKFVHNTGFIAALNSEDSALRFARIMSILSV